MKKLLVVFLFIHLSEISYSQSIVQKQNYSLALRGKAIGFFIIEDCYFSTATIGTELTVKGGHSFGVDLTFFGWRYEDDDNDENPLTEAYEKRNYMYLDYKYRFLKLEECDIYFNTYNKIGLYDYWQEGVAEGYNNWEMPSLTDKIRGTFNQVGAGIGIKKFYTDRSYIDISVNGGRVYTNDHTHTYDQNLKTSVDEYNVKNSKPIFYIRINFGIILKGEYGKRPALLEEQ
jgi:hypothetical protein